MSCLAFFLQGKQKHGCMSPYSYSEKEIRETLVTFADKIFTARDVIEFSWKKFEFLRLKPDKFSRGFTLTSVLLSGLLLKIFLCNFTFNFDNTECKI